ncbi:hypothetical protein BASA82_000051 [Batrachochytrium salamandrivorans]|nr:hypothetical protein BASA81_000322 [Batrachochytrium salamandrivorans]KAH9262936.1 hypothetical protein BASA82_000051 [Batrachochytrium salamandrivorans]
MQSLKIEFDNSLRRVNISAQAKFADLTVALTALLGVSDFTVQYRDEEGDLITIATDQELAEILHAESNKVTRLLVTRGQSSAPSQTPTPPPAPKLPFEDAAKLLSDSSKVEEILNKFVTSPLVLDAVTGTANEYLATNGNFGAALQHAMEQSQVLRAVAQDVLQQYPELETLGGNDGFSHFFTPPDLFTSLFAQPELFANLFGQVQQECQQTQAAHEEDSDVWVHLGVVCDGCDNSPALKQKSLENRHRGPRRGFIVGDRFKSKSVHNFDLCQSCHDTGLFEDQYAPFSTITGEEGGRRFQRGGWGWGGCRRGGGRRHGHHHGHDHDHHHGQHHGHHHGHHHDQHHDHHEQHAAVPTAVAAVATGPSEPVAPVPKQSPAPAAPVPKQEDDWVKIISKWAPQLELLASLGFANLDSYLTILEEEHGDLERVINRIIRRES